MLLASPWVCTIGPLPRLALSETTLCVSTGPPAMEPPERYYVTDAEVPRRLRADDDHVARAERRTHGSGENGDRSVETEQRPDDEDGERRDGREQADVCKRCDPIANPHAGGEARLRDEQECRRRKDSEPGPSSALLPRP